MKCSVIIDEDFNHYKKPSMVIGAAYCDGKCCNEAGIDRSICHNYDLQFEVPVDVSPHYLVDRYLKNSISEALVFAGLEPLLQFNDMKVVIDEFRRRCSDDIVIYTGYNENEIEYEVKMLSRYKNIIIKFGRYIPNTEPIEDELLGVKLISNNQYSKKIS